ncbi:TetR/AcrR family transcriptional regulator [Pseudomonas citri]|uniref:TetR/AcrR family transcriptional regulator n=1 Tax=Pseudomonas citri TaxID=2978349 RepID=UPI0021B4DA18|nr:helix-turn-helix domain-containing protein [Pseudomonas citri]
MKKNTRDRMIIGAVDLLRRRGVHATSVREVVRHSNTPRGSIAHHFPGGKRQLLEAALEQAGLEVSTPLATLLESQGLVEGLERFVAGWRQMLEDSQYQAGCAVLAVAVEQYSSEQRADVSPEQDDQIQQQLLDQAHGIFSEWQRIISRAMQASGITAQRAGSLATMIIAAIEGAVALCRAARSAEPLDVIWQELRRSLEREQA